MWGHTQSRSSARQCTSVEQIQDDWHGIEPCCSLLYRGKLSYHANLRTVGNTSGQKFPHNSVFARCLEKGRAEKPCGLSKRERERESRWTVTHLRGRHVIQWNGNTIYSPIPSIRGNEKRKSDIRVRTISSGRRSNDLSYVRYFTLRPVSARMNGSFAKIVSSRVKKSNEVNVNVFQRVRARRSPLPNCAKKFHQSSIIRRLLLSSHQGEGWERLAIRSEAE